MYTILYLQSELQGYHIPILEEYVESYNAEVYVVHRDYKRNTPYVHPSLNGVTYYKKSVYNNKEKLLELVENINPEIIRISGWTDKDYIYVCGELKKRGCIIVVSSDTQWRSSIKQKIGSIFFKFYLKNKFDYIWVAGPYQYEYAKRLGFKNDKILFNCLSADTKLFSKYTKEKIKEEFPHKFVFLGRFEEIKGIKTLLKAWSNVNDKKDWTLTFIGNGTLKDKLGCEPNIIVKDFLQPNELANELKNYGVLILPSLFEPWAVVIHEAMVNGIPVLSTNVCGAAPIFIIPGFTGYTFPPNDSKSLQDLMQKTINTSDEDLLKLSHNAFKRSEIITPKIAAATLMSVLK